jgi:hypothetical protein
MVKRQIGRALDPDVFPDPLFVAVELRRLSARSVGYHREAGAGIPPRRARWRTSLVRSRTTKTRCSDAPVVGANNHRPDTGPARTCDQRWRAFLMASVESVGEGLEAAERGWRYFRIRQPCGELERFEILCPFESRERQCFDCGLCSGTRLGAKHVVITVHGPRACNLRGVA